MIFQLPTQVHPQMWILFQSAHNIPPFTERSPRSQPWQPWAGQGRSSFLPCPAPHCPPALHKSPMSDERRAFQPCDLLFSLPFPTPPLQKQIDTARVPVHFSLQAASPASPHGKPRLDKETEAKIKEPTQQLA